MCAVFITNVNCLRFTVLDIAVFLVLPVLPTAVYNFVHPQFRIVFTWNVYSIRFKRATVRETGLNFYP